MFERLVVKNIQGYGPLIDIGALAESVILYGQVELLANGATVDFLLKHIPPRIVLRAVQSGRLRLKYQTTMLGVATQARSGARSVHGFVTITPQPGSDREPYPAFLAATNDKLAARRFARAVEPIAHMGYDANVVRDTLNDVPTTERAVQAVLQRVAPLYAGAGPVRFRVQPDPNGFVVDTNINFDALNDEYHVSVPQAHSSMSEAYLLALLQGVYEEIYLAGNLKAEIAVGPLSRDLHEQLIAGTLEKLSPSERRLEPFRELIIDSTYDIRAAVNSGKVAFAEALRLADKADKFRNWLQSRPADGDLVKEYYAATVAGSWVEKLPVKTTRFGLFTGAGLAADTLMAGGLGTVAGVAIGALDSFVLDKLIGGWKPHHFIEGELKEATRRK